MRRTKQDLLCLETMNTGQARLYDEYHSGNNDCEERVERFREFGWLHEGSRSLNGKGVGIADLVHYLRTGGDGTDLINDVGVPKTVEFAEFLAPDEAFQVIQRLKEFGYTAGEDYEIRDVESGFRKDNGTRVRDQFEVVNSGSTASDDMIDILEPLNWVYTDYKRDKRFQGNRNQKRLIISI